MSHRLHISLTAFRLDNTSKTPSSAALPSHSAPKEESIFDKLLMDSLGSIVSGRRRIGRNKRLLRREERLGSLYVIRFGQFKLTGEDSQGKQRVVGFQMPGDWIGLNAIATGRHEFGAIALEDSEVIEIPFDAVRKMMMSMQTPVQEQILEVMSKALNDKCNDSMYIGASIDCRFARFLLGLSEKYARLGFSKKTFRLSMSRSDLGNFLGSTCESMSRAVARFNAAGIVTISGRNVDIHNWIGLHSLSNGVHPDKSAQQYINPLKGIALFEEKVHVHICN